MVAPVALGTTRQALRADVVEEQLLVARLVLDVDAVEVQVDRDRQADPAIAAGYVVGASEQHTLTKVAMRVVGDAVAHRFN